MNPVLCTQEKHGEVRGTVPVLRGYGRASSSPPLAGKNVNMLVQAHIFSAVVLIGSAAIPAPNQPLLVFLLSNMQV